VGGVRDGTHVLDLAAKPPPPEVTRDRAVPWQR
jgi:hypothetical protein